MADWIRVQDRLPGRMRAVLLCLDGQVTYGMLRGSEWLVEGGSSIPLEDPGLTHWMEMPKAPKISTKEGE
jgi:hypothetical protein